MSRGKQSWIQRRSGRADSLLLDHITVGTADLETRPAGSSSTNTDSHGCTRWHNSAAATGTQHMTQPTANMHTHASLNIDTGHTQKLGTHTQMCSCMHSITASCFPSEPSGAPFGPWCHWWGHVLGQRQHRDGPLRAAANYEVMDQHMLTHTRVHVHTHSGRQTGHLTSPVTGSSSSWRNFTPPFWPNLKSAICCPRVFIFSLFRGLKVCWLVAKKQGKIYLRQEQQ